MATMDWTHRPCYACAVTAAPTPPGDALPPITQLLQRASEGDGSALGEVFQSLYPDLKRIARARLYNQGRGDGMQTTTLVHETFLKLVARRLARIEDRRHFFAYVAKTMRHLIIDSAREHLAARRGGGAEHVTMSAAEVLAAEGPDADQSLLQVHEALAQLETLDPELARLIELRYFGGYTEVEVGELLGVDARTVRRRWDKGRAWLYLALDDKPA